MRYIRFMRSSEVDDLLAGKKLMNHTNHKREMNGNTDSVGFCFFDTSEEPEERMRYLTGIVSMNAVVEIETNMEMKKGFGMYADPEDRADIWGILTGQIKPKMIRKTEYSTTEYGLDTVEIIRLGRPHTWPHRIEWIWRKSESDRKTE